MCLPHGWHALDIECKGMLSIGVLRLLVRNRFSVGLTQTTIRPLLPSLFCSVFGVVGVVIPIDLSKYFVKTG